MMISLFKASATDASGISCRHHLLDTVEARFCLGGRGVGEDELALDLAQLLLIHPLSAGFDDIVLLLEFDERLCACRSVGAQAFDTILQPAAGPLCRLIFGFQLINDIGVANRIGDLSGLAAIERPKGNLHHIRQRNPADLPAAFECG